MIRNSCALRFTCDGQTGAGPPAWSQPEKTVIRHAPAFTASDSHDLSLEDFVRNQFLNDRSHDLSIRTLFLLCLSAWVWPAQNTGSRFGATNPAGNNRNLTSFGAD